MIFRKATAEEKDAVFALYRSAVGREACAWNDDYPTMFEIDGDYNAGNLFVMAESGEIIGASSIVPENELDGLECWKIKEGAREIARIVVADGCHGMGIAAAMVGSLIEILRKQGSRAVHLSVADDNLPARKIYENAGFEPVGEADMYGGHYILQEKAL